MGVLNVTPDSFSDGGEWLEPASSDRPRHGFVERGCRHHRCRRRVDQAGRDSAGGLRRVTTRDAGNPRIGGGRRVRQHRHDAGGGRRAGDRSRCPAGQRRLWRQGRTGMLRLVAEAGDPVRLHALARTLRRHAKQSVLRRRRGRGHRRAACSARRSRARRRSRRNKLIIDPGLGFAKTGEHNWQLLQRLEEFEVLGRPMLVGVSRKTFLGRLLAAADGSPRPAKQRDDATTALTAVLAMQEVWGVRVHSVRASRDAIAVAQRLQSD